MSILDSVLDAERRAEQHRTKAQSEVKDLLELTRINATKKAEELIRSASDEKTSIFNAVQKSIEEKEKVLDNEYRKQDEELTSLAEKRMDEVVSFVLERVIEL